MLQKEKTKKARPGGYRFGLFCRALRWQYWQLALQVRVDIVVDV
jgi:hypothetical protein